MLEYSSLSDSEHSGQPVCDRCLQEVDQEVYSANLASMRANVAEHEKALAAARNKEREAEVTAFLPVSARV